MELRRLLFVFVVMAAAAFALPWDELTNMPYLVSGEVVNSGGCLAVDTAGMKIYGAKGHRTSDFYVYDVPAGDWAVKRDIPLGVEAKPVDDGGCMIYDGYRYLYLVKGNYTLGFWRYDVQGDSWSQMMDVPLGAHGVKVSGGTDMVFARPGGHGYIYLLKGYYNEFYRFSVADDWWEEMPPAPVGIDEHWPDGSWLAFDGDHTIYAHKARYHEFYAFNTNTGAWEVTPRYPMPLIGASGIVRKSGDGSCGAWLDGSIYALKGNGTGEFWRYFVAADSWAECETIPPFGSTGRLKRVRNGGDIVSFAGRLYALKGYQCNEFWRYDPASSGVEQGATPCAFGPKPVATILRGALRLRDCHPVSAGETGGCTQPVLLDAAGRKVMDLLPGPNDVRGLAPGVYFVRELSAVSRGPSAVHKVVVTR